MQRWVISDAKDEDANEIAAFAPRAWDEYHRAQGHDAGIDWGSRPIILVARDAAGMVVAIARGRISAGVGHLSELLVAPASRGSGLGTALLEAFESRCWAAGCHKLTLHAESDGPARAFYERRGWQLEAIHRRDKAGLDFARLVKFRDNAGTRPR